MISELTDFKLISLNSVDDLTPLLAGGDGDLGVQSAAGGGDLKVEEPRRHGDGLRAGGRPAAAVPPLSTKGSVYDYDKI